MLDRQSRISRLDLGQGPPEHDQVITGAEIRGFLRHRGRAIAFPILVVLAAAYAYVELATPMYSARAQIIIDPRLPQFIPGRNEETVLAWDSAQVESEIAVLQSERIASMVVKKLELNRANDFRTRPSLLADLKTYLMPTAADPPSDHDRFREALFLIQDGLSVRRSGLSYAIDISFTFPDPLRAAEIANATAEAYILDQLEIRSQAARLGGEWLQERMVKLRTQMNAAAQAVQLFRASHNYRISRVSPSDATANSDTATDTTALDTSQEGGKTLDELEAASSTYRRIYESFLQSYTESVQRQSFPVSDAHILTPASLPLVKSSPRVTLIFALATLLGCLSGFGLAILLHNLDRTIRSPQQLKDRFGLDDFGSLPQLSRRPIRALLGSLLRRRFAFAPNSSVKLANVIAYQAASGRRWMPSRHNAYFTAALTTPDSPFSRAILTLKTFVELARRTRPIRCVGITATHSGHGTSTIVSNLASVFADAGWRTLVIDADLQGRSLTRHLKMEHHFGLADILAGTATTDQVICRFPDTALNFLPAVGDGTLPCRKRVIDTDAMDLLIQKLARDYDIVIVDLPALLPVGDVLAVSPLLDGLVLAVEWGKTSTNIMETTVEYLGRAQATVLGFVMTKVQT